ncbi:MAG: 3-isopropylmalate dehydrogenase [Planctomycetes bacterium]|nr:3-isopropylmalate dehydrogenase [Planctomycetota bacterium]
MPNYSIGIIGGDGIGPEVVREGMRVLDAAEAIYGFKTHRTIYPFGADHFLKTGETMPQSAIAEIGKMHAAVLGAIGDPRVETGKLEFAIIAGLRFQLELYVNLRPIKLYDSRFCPLKEKGPEHIDYVVVRENTEDAYCASPFFFKKGTPDEVAQQSMIYTRKGTERVIRYAYELARKRGKKRKLTLCDKANAVRAQDLWTRTFAEVGKEYPDIAQDHGYVDAMTMWLIKNPEFYDVIVAPNLFGDIITDLSAMLQGGMGIAAGGNIHPGGPGVFEPIHGSAPKYAGQNKANPLATVLAISMLLDHVGQGEASKAVEEAVARCLRSGKVTSLQAGVHKTDELGKLVVDELKTIGR